MGKRVDQSQNASLQSYKFEKWEDFFVVGIFASFQGEFDTSKPKFDDVLGVIYRLTILDLFHAKENGGRKDLISHVFIVSLLIQC